MAITEGKGAGSKVTYVSWKRDTELANNGTLLVDHATDKIGLRHIQVKDNASNGGLGRIVTDAEIQIDIMSDTQVKVTNKCGAATIAAAAADAGNTGGGTSPTSGGAYTGKADGTLTLECTLAGEAGTAKLKATFPDGTVIEDIVTGATTVAKAIGQGVTFAITSGTGDDFALGDKFTIALQAGTKDLTVIAQVVGY